MSQVAAELVQGAACNHGARVLHRDYETRSQATLKKIGTYRYASDLATEVLCCGFAVDDGPVQLWTSGDPPAEFIEAATNPAWIVAAHGAHFEDAIDATFCTLVLAGLGSLLRSSFAPRQWRWPWGYRPD